MTAFEYHRPDSVEAACGLLSEFQRDARVVAGGTGVGILVKERLLDAGHLVSLERLALDAVAWRDGALHVGAMASLQTLLGHELVRAHVPMLGQVIAHVACRRIRNVATLGGNLCWAEPASDPPGALIALGAEATVRSVRGERRIAARDLITDYMSNALEPDELLTSVRIPAPPRGAGFAYLRHAPQSKADRPVIGVTALLERRPDGRIARARLCVAAVGPTPVSLPEADAELVGEAVDGAAVARVAARYAAAVNPVSDSRGSERHKRHIVGVLVRRALRQAWTQEVGA